MSNVVSEHVLEESSADVLGPRMYGSKVTH